jgi:hypothetical protein
MGLLPSWAIAQASVFKKSAAQLAMCYRSHLKPTVNG